MLTSRAFRTCTLPLLIASAPLDAAEHWIELSTPHFEMYTTNGEKQAVAALALFEQVRYFFAQNSRSQTGPDARIKVIAFRSDKEFKPYRPNEGAFAFYQRTHLADYVVMQDLDTNNRESVMHEYTHLVIEHLGLKLPAWLNEGLADLYSSLEPHGDQALVGQPLAGRSRVLLTQRWLDLNTLFAVDDHSPYYNESNKMSIFYAQSWALTHMLSLGGDYRPRFADFLAAVASGTPIGDCFQTVYGKNFTQVRNDLEKYVRHSTVQVAVFNVRLPKEELQPTIADADGFKLDLALADLLLNGRTNTRKGFSRLQSLANSDPDSPEIWEDLAFYKWEHKDPNGAKQDLKAAIDKGSRDATVFELYTQLLQESGASPSEMYPVLQRIAELKPDSADAWLNLGSAAAPAGQYGVALDAFNHIKKITPDKAFPLFAQQAFCYLKLDKPEEARPMLLRAEQYAQTPDQKFYLSNLRRVLQSLTKQ